MAKDLTKIKEIEKMKKTLEDDTLPGLETPDSTKASFFKMDGFPIIEGTSPYRSAVKSRINMESILAGAESANEIPDTTAATEALHNKLQNAIISAGTKMAQKETGPENPDAPKTTLKEKIKTGLGNIKQFFQ
tara:strand:- start:489 stop:887 length:399 start_codon:yes stop_codon:yes gene_type:complete